MSTKVYANIIIIMYFIRTQVNGTGYCILNVFWVCVWEKLGSPRGKVPHTDQLRIIGYYATVLQAQPTAPNPV